MLKSELRKQAKEQRKALSAEQIQIKNKQIHERIMRFPFSEKSKIHCFLPIARQIEIDTYPIIASLGAQHHTLVVPKVVGEALQHFVFEDREQLSAGAFGVPEPQRGVQLDAKELDFVLIPLLAMDEQGNRLGYGKGFYDRFLSHCRADCIFVGLNWFPPVGTIQNEAHDVQLDYGIWPEGEMRFG